MSKESTMKIKVALLFGGKSAEHDISVISALQACRHLDRNKYDVYPIYITKDGEMYYGEETGSIESYTNIEYLLSRSHRVYLSREGGRVFLSYEKKPVLGGRHVAAIDVALPVVHGTNVEDGTIQGYLRLLGLPYCGCDLLSSAIGMDKYLTKTVLREAGIPVLDCSRADSTRYGSDAEGVMAEIEEKIGYPVIVKPVNCGSSIGISKASNREALKAALDDAFSYSHLILAERAITALREINCSVLGDGESAEASECEEPVGSDEILSFNDKYVGGNKGGAKTDTDAKGMASLKRKIPAPITKEQRDYIRSTAVSAFKALGCGGVARIDFLLDTETGEIFFNEINTIPGSLSFYLWEPLGVSYTSLLDRIIALALKRERRERSLTYTFESSVLSGASLGGTKGAKGAKM